MKTAILVMAAFVLGSLLAGLIDTPPAVHDASVNGSSINDNSVNDTTANANANATAQGATAYLWPCPLAQASVF